MRWLSLALAATLTAICAISCSDLEVGPRNSPVPAVDTTIGRDHNILLAMLARSVDLHEKQSTDLGEYLTSALSCIDTFRRESGRDLPRLPRDLDRMLITTLVSNLVEWRNAGIVDSSLSRILAPRALSSYLVTHGIIPPGEEDLLPRLMAIADEREKQGDSLDELVDACRNGVAYAGPRWQAAVDILSHSLQYWTLDSKRVSVDDIAKGFMDLVGGLLGAGIGAGLGGPAGGTWGWRIGSMGSSSVGVAICDIPSTYPDGYWGDGFYFPPDGWWTGGGFDDTTGSR